MVRKGEDSIIRVTDEKTGKFKRYEDKQGRALAVLVRGKLQLTTKGLDRGLIISDGKLINMKTGVESW